MNLIVLTSVDSTNNYLQQLLEKEMAVEGTLVVAYDPAEIKVSIRQHTSAYVSIRQHT